MPIICLSKKHNTLKNPIPSCHPYQQICGPLWECPYWGSCSLPWVGRPGKSSPHRYDLAAEMLLAETKISELWNLLIKITVFSLKQTKTSSKTYCGTYVADFYNPIIQAFQLVQLCSLHNPAGTWLGNDFFFNRIDNWAFYCICNIIWHSFHAKVYRYPVVSAKVHSTLFWIFW